MNDHWDGFDDAIYNAARLMKIVEVIHLLNKEDQSSRIDSILCPNILLLMKERYH